MSNFSTARFSTSWCSTRHTFSGSQGAEAACLIRRLRSYCGREPERTVCVATSATIVDVNNPDAARDFASRFFGVERAMQESELVDLPLAAEGSDRASEKN